MAIRSPTTGTGTSATRRPPFSDLPVDKSGPHGNAWGLYGPDDELGALNLLTPEAVREAAKEIREGTRFCTDLPLNFLEKPFFSRDRLRHEIRHLQPRSVNDDWIGLNTQSSTQWDGFRHYGLFPGAHLLSSTGCSGGWRRGCRGLSLKVRTS